MFNIVDSFVIAATTDVKDLLNATPQPGHALEPVEDMVKEYGTGGMSLAQTIFVYSAAIAVIVVAILMVLYGRNRNKISEVKDGIGWQILGGVLGFAAIGFILFLQSIGANLFKN